VQIYLECREISYESIVLYWTVDKEAHERVTDFLFTVEKSESPNGPWSPLPGTPVSAFGYIDTDTQRGMIDIRIYYRVRANNKTGKEYSSNTQCIFEEERNFITNYIAECEDRYMLQRYNGNEFLHFSRKKFGDRCHHCYDEVERKSIKPKCPFCYGTTYEGGFFTPTRILINVDPKAKVADRNEYGVLENFAHSGWTSNRVIIEELDMVVSLDKSSIRYLVNQVIPTGIHGSVTRQQLNLTQLKVDSPYQLLSVDVEAYPIYELNVFRRDWQIHS
jgi:hypothetical protein